MNSNRDHRSKEIIFSKNGDSIEDLFYEFLKRLTRETAISYRRDLKEFFSFSSEQFGLPRISGNRILFHEIKPVHIVKYKVHLELFISRRRRPYAPNTVNRKLSSIASFFQFLAQRKLIKENPGKSCRRLKGNNVEETQAFSDREMRALFDLVIAEATPLHRAVILLLFTTGMRQGELRKLKLDNFKMVEGILFMRYLGKGQKLNKIPIHPTTAYYIDQYIGWMKQIDRKICENDFVFQPTKNSYNGKFTRKLSHSAVGYIVGKWAKKINSEKRITPHSARATFISSLLDNGEDLYYVAQLVNHSDVRTTQHYNKRRRNHRRNPIFNLNFF